MPSSSTAGAEIYDPLDAHRRDLNVYVDLVDELGAHSVLDFGCGTGTFACLLAQRGKEVTGLDPAAASLEVARRKHGADRVRWPRWRCDHPASTSGGSRDHDRQRGPGLPR